MIFSLTCFIDKTTKKKPFWLLSYNISQLLIPLIQEFTIQFQFMEIT